jgi:hypothetical protein
MSLKRPEETFVRTNTELMELWQAMMGPGGFAQRSVWHIFFEPDGRMNPLVVPIDDVPEEPDELLLRNLAYAVREAIRDTDVACLAALLSRPGPAQMSAHDRRWAQELRAAFGPALCPWPIHLATRGRVQVFAPDDLIAA